MGGRRKLNEIDIADADTATGSLCGSPGIHSAAKTPATKTPATKPPADACGDTDGELLRRHVAGDTEAFGLLFLRHKERLWAVALRTACDHEEAADALQEAMVSAFRRAADFRGDSAVTTWLHRIVVNAAVDRLRRRSGRMLNWSGEEDALDSLSAGLPRPLGDAMDSAEVRLDVSAALRQLPDQQRIALVLVDMMGYPVAEVSEMLGVSVGTVKSRCARGRARLLPFLSHLRGSSVLGEAQPAAFLSSGQEGAA